MKFKLQDVYFYLSRLFLVFSSPLFYALLFMVLGAYARHPVFYIGLVVLFLLSSAPLYDWVERKMFIRYLKDIPRDKVYDYVIVMGGFSRYDHGRHRIEFNDRADRLIEAVLFYKVGRARKILITGDGSISQLRPWKSKEYVEGNPEQMYLFLEALGVPRKDVLFEFYARNTLENAVGVHRILKENDSSAASLLMVTSAYHVRRALYSFSLVGLHPDYYAVDLVKDFVSPPLYGMPDLAITGKWQELLHQIVGVWLVKLKKHL